MGLLTATLLALTAPGAMPVPAPSDAQVRLTLNRDAYGPGDPVRAQVEVSDDGYLIVFRVDGDGRVRVVFPMDPDLDAFVRGGRRYELRGRNASATFSADDLGGAGVVFAALSRDPLRFGQFAVGDHWDYETLHLGELADDPEAALHRLVRLMSGNGRYDYDVRGYRVHAPPTVVQHEYRYPLVLRVNQPLGCFGCGGWARPTIGLRIAVDPWDTWYDSWYDYRPHIAMYDHPSWYDYYWYNAGWGDPYWRYAGAPSARIYYPGQYAPYTTVNNWYRPRPDPNPRVNERARPRSPVAVPVGFISSGAADARPTREPLAGTARPTTPQPDRARPRATPPSSSTGSVQPPPTQQQPPVRAGSSGSTQQQGRGQQTTGQTGSQQGSTATPPPTRARPPVGGGQTQQGQQGGGQGGQGGGTRAVVTTPPPATSGTRPVFRDPPPTPVRQVRDTVQRPPVTSRPVYREPARPTTPPTQTGRTADTREPPRSTTPPPATQPPPRTREPVRDATPPRTEARPPARSTPPPPPPPPSRPTSTVRSSPPPPPPPPPPTSSGGGQSRARPPVGGGF